MTTLGKMPLPDRFWAQVDKSSTNGCWLWTGTTDFGGYGRLRIDGVKVKAHRYSWELYNGDIPEGQWVLHRCDVRKCVNPAHLFLGNRQDNVDDMMRKGRFAPLTGEKNGQARLNAEQVREIRHLHATGVPQRALGRQFGVTKTAIYLIVRRKKWATLE